MGGSEDHPAIRLHNAFPFACPVRVVDVAAMKDHEWFEPDAETGERRYFRAGKFGKRWTVRTTLKSEPDWTALDPIPRPVLEALRTLLFNKYQRRRVPWEDVVAVDRLVTAAGGQAIYAPNGSVPGPS